MYKVFMFYFWTLTDDYLTKETSNTRNHQKLSISFNNLAQLNVLVARLELQPILNPLTAPRTVAISPQANYTD
jgi:hypothetical protein